MHPVALSVVFWMSAAPPAMTVCDVLADDPTALVGKIIKVKGLLASSSHGTSLFEECKTHLVTKGLSWANSLSVYVDASDAKTASSWWNMERKLKQLHADPLRDKIWVTFVGRLETRQSMADAVVEHPYGLSRAGFGHMGESPALINVMTVDDIFVEPRKRDTNDAVKR